MSWSEAKQLYDAGKFQDALNQIDFKTLHTADEFNNAGLVLYKNGQPAKAYAYFMKAKVLSGGAEDVNHNLTVTSEKLRSSGIGAPGSSLKINTFALNAKTMSPAWVGLPIGLFLLAAGACFQKARRKTLWAWAAGTCVLAAVAVGAAYWELRSDSLMVVQSQAADVRSGPAETFSAVGKINAGAVVESTDDARQDEAGARWRQIEFGKDNLGWAKEEDLLAL